MKVTLARRWRAFWFAPEAAGNLAAARVLVALHALWIVLSRDYAGMADVPAVFWSATTEMSRWRYLISPGAGAVEAALQGLAVVALVGAIAGLAPRLSCALSGVLLYHLAPLETLIWQPVPDARGLTLAPVLLLLLAASPSGDALALWPRGRRRGMDFRSGRFGWALRLIQLQVVAIYLFAAIGKVQRTGFDWGSPERIRLWLLWFNQDVESVVFGTLGPWLAQFVWVCASIGIATLLLEWLMPLAIGWRRTRGALVAIALAFHVGILLAMNIHVPEAWLVVLLVDWAWVWRKSRTAARGVSVPVSV